MKFSEVKPKVRKFNLELSLEEAEMLKAIVGNFNSVGQKFTCNLWEKMESAGVANTYVITEYDGQPCPTLEVHEK